MQSDSIPASFQPLRVLLVEDSSALAERLSEIIHLRIPDITLIGAADTEAAAVGVVEREAVDVIILDLQLRQGSGFGVLRTLMAMQFRPQILVWTSYDQPEYRTAALALGATDVFDKSSSLALLNALRQINDAHHPKH